MKDYIYIPPSSRTAEKHLKPALRGVSLLERRGICFWRRRFHVAWFDLTHPKLYGLIQPICDDRIKPIETVEVGQVEPAG